MDRIKIIENLDRKEENLRKKQLKINAEKKKVKEEKLMLLGKLYCEKNNFQSVDEALDSLELEFVCERFNLN
ncbi:hypothetical protein IGK74_002315 [Enterococcus sp. AZ150]|uniref:hypothetical protein n=1 Tax=Enterococcus sp. AZ150 TaxID=2774866 RepID=UPI003F23383E